MRLTPQKCRLILNLPDFYDKITFPGLQFDLTAL